VNIKDRDLELKGITKKFGSFTAVQDFNIAMRKGEFLSFLGPSGCGKTTTLRMIAGFIEPTEGDIFIQGRKVTELPPYKRNIGMVFQNYALFPHLTVFDNISFGLRYRKVAKPDVKGLVDEMLELVELPGLGERKPAELSGGQQQRVALARALIIKPKVLLMDEPLSNLDAKLREGLRIELRQIQKELGITTVFVTHDQEEALTLSDRIAVMDQGRVTQIGTPHEIYETPQSTFEASFIGQSNLFQSRVQAVQDDTVTVSLKGDLTLNAAFGDQFKAGDQRELLIRAERIRVLGKARREHGQDRMNVIKGVIENLAYLGGNVHYYIRLENNELMMAIEQTSDYGKPLQPNDNVFLEISYASCRLLTE